MAHELAVVDTADEPLVAKHPEIPSNLALQGFDSVRAYSASPEASRDLLEGTLSFTPVDDNSVGSQRRCARVVLRIRPAARGARHSRGWHGSPRRLGLDNGGSRGLARSRRPRRDAADPGDRPLLVPIRCTSASRAACSSRSPRWGPGSPTTKTRRISASRSDPAAGIRASPRAGRAGADAASEPAGRLERAMSAVSADAPRTAR